MDGRGVRFSYRSIPLLDREGSRRRGFFPRKWIEIPERKGWKRNKGRRRRRKRRVSRPMKQYVYYIFHLLIFTNLALPVVFVVSFIFSIASSSCTKPLFHQITDSLFYRLYSNVDTVQMAYNVSTNSVRFRVIKILYFTTLAAFLHLRWAAAQLRDGRNFDLP